MGEPPHRPGGDEPRRVTPLQRAQAPAAAPGAPARATIAGTPAITASESNGGAGDRPPSRRTAGRSRAKRGQPDPAPRRRAARLTEWEDPRSGRLVRGPARHSARGAAAARRAASAARRSCRAAGGTWLCTTTRRRRAPTCTRSCPSPLGDLVGQQPPPSRYNPLVGHLTDRTRSGLGRRLPYILGATPAPPTCRRPRCAVFSTLSGEQFQALLRRCARCRAPRPRMSLVGWRVHQQPGRRRPGRERAPRRRLSFGR